jgi:hypothetical protein
LPFFQLEWMFLQLSKKYTNRVCAVEDITACTTLCVSQWPFAYILSKSRKNWVKLFSAKVASILGNFNENIHMPSACAPFCEYAGQCLITFICLFMKISTAAAVKLYWEHFHFPFWREPLGFNFIDHPVYRIYIYFLSLTHKQHLLLNSFRMLLCGNRLSKICNFKSFEFKWNIKILMIIGM